MSNATTIIMLVLIAVVGVFTLDVYLPGMPSMANQFGVTLTDISYTFTAFSIVFAFAQLFHGVISDRFGRKPVILAGLVVAALATTSCISANSYNMLFASRMLQAVGISAFVVVNAIIRDLYTGTQAVQVRTLVATVSGVSISVAPTVGGLLQSGYGWQGGFWASLILILITLSYALFFYSESNQSKQAVASSLNEIVNGYVSLFKSKSYLMNVVMAMLAYTVHFSFIILSAKIFISYMGATPLVFGYLMIIYGGVYFAGGLFATWIAKRLTVDSLIKLGGLLIISGGLLMLSLSSIQQLASWHVLLPMAVITIGVTISRASAITGALAPIPSQAGQGAAGLNLIQFALSAVIATIISRLGTNPQLSIGLLAIGCGISINYLIKRVNA